jgi:hypothetical protein
VSDLDEYLASKYEYATFECEQCKHSLPLSVGEVSRLTEAATLTCCNCQATIKACAEDQSALSAIDNHLATSGKFLLPFSIIWFPACIVVSIFYGGLFSGVMVTLGLFIALGFKGAVPAVDEVMVLTRHLDSDQPVSLEKSALN